MDSVLSVSREAYIRRVTMGRHDCNNCGQTLTDENVRLAIEDALMLEEELSFCCPSYDWHEGCKGYSIEDQKKPAYWRTA